MSVYIKQSLVSKQRTWTHVYMHVCVKTRHSLHSLAPSHVHIQPVLPWERAPAPCACHHHLLFIRLLQNRVALLQTVYMYARAYLCMHVCRIALRSSRLYACMQYVYMYACKIALRFSRLYTCMCKYLHINRLVESFGAPGVCVHASMRICAVHVRAPRVCALPMTCMHTSYIHTCVCAYVGIYVSVCAHVCIQA